MCEERLPHYVKGIEYKNLTVALRQLRKALERGTQLPIEATTDNTADLLQTVCLWLGLNQEQIAEVLGAKAYLAVMQKIAMRQQHLPPS
ncbi:MAG TPA: hypothetical protein VJG32_00425 [Anaerolineae bacterium]|nr:hypothetical protein [Anaerolineae bacterium]